jgi:hypothetical protein
VKYEFRETTSKFYETMFEFHETTITRNTISLSILFYIPISVSMLSLYIYLVLSSRALTSPEVFLRLRVRVPVNILHPCLVPDSDSPRGCCGNSPRGRWRENVTRLPTTAERHLLPLPPPCRRRPLENTPPPPAPYSPTCLLPAAKPRSRMLDHELGDGSICALR